MRSPPVKKREYQEWSSERVCQQRRSLGGFLLPDPYYGLNEQQAQWVGERDWLYRLKFTLDASLLSQPCLELHFAGLDTLCTVWLNGQELLSSDNMFVPQRRDVRAHLQAGENTLQLLFRSVLNAGHALARQHGERTIWNGDASRVYLRKAQYHYGWDWGPMLLCAGPWQPVTLRAYSTRIEDVHLPSQVSADLRMATIPVHAHLSGQQAHADQETLETVAELYAPDGRLLAIQTCESVPKTQTRPSSTKIDTEARFIFPVECPEL